jgi:hypothetical protein
MVLVTKNKNSNIILNLKYLQRYHNNNNNSFSYNIIKCQHCKNIFLELNIIKQN